MKSRLDPSNPGVSESKSQRCRRTEPRDAVQKVPFQETLGKDCSVGVKVSTSILPLQQHIDLVTLLLGSLSQVRDP